MNGCYGLAPGEPYPVLAVCKRRWWQIWKPPTWTEWQVRLVPPPDHPNCRCVARPDSSQ